MRQLGPWLVVCLSWASALERDPSLNRKSQWQLGSSRASSLSSASFLRKHPKSGTPKDEAAHNPEHDEGWTDPIRRKLPPSPSSPSPPSPPPPSPPSPPSPPPPSPRPTRRPTNRPTAAPPPPTPRPSLRPSARPTFRPSIRPTAVPTPAPTLSFPPTASPKPTGLPTLPPSAAPTGTSAPTSGPSNPPSSVPTLHPTILPTVTPNATCQRILDASYDDVLLSTYTSMEDAYDSDKYGHAKLACAERLLADKQYEKSIPYLWCASPHCSKCKGDGDGCPSTAVGLTTEDDCRSGCFTLLGFAERKKKIPDFPAAEKYYRKALRYRERNCGALAYLTEFYVQTNNLTQATKSLDKLCTYCSAKEFPLVNKTFSYFTKNKWEVPPLEACGTKIEGSKSNGDGEVASMVTLFLIGGAVGLVVLGAAAGGYAYMTTTSSSVKVRSTQQTKARSVTQRTTRVHSQPGKGPPSSSSLSSSSSQYRTEQQQRKERRSKSPKARAKGMAKGPSSSTSLVGPSSSASSLSLVG